MDPKPGMSFSQISGLGSGGSGNSLQGTFRGARDQAPGNNGAPRVVVHPTEALFERGYDRATRGSRNWSDRFDDGGWDP